MKKVGKIFSLVLLLISGTYVFYGLYKVLKHYKVATRTPTNRLYIKHIPFYFDDAHLRKIRLASQTIGGIFTVAVIAFILLQNFSPFGTKMTFAQKGETKNITPLSPKERVTQITLDGQTAYKQIGDLVYFNVKMPYHFDKATVHITFKNPYPDQDIFLGFKDQSDWHYTSTLIDSPFLNSVPWSKVTDSLSLYEKNKQYNSLAAFKKDPPKDALIGVYNIDASKLDPYITDLPDYTPSKTPTVITTPLRGRHTMLAFLKGEPFKMKITKQDLNWYAGSDEVAIKIYKGNDEVMEKVIPDDGVDDSSRKATGVQSEFIQNPGPDLPEPGVYRIVIEANSDTIIKKIETNLHKVVFADQIYPVSNGDVYQTRIASTSATTFVTNAVLLDMSTYHDKAFQKIQIGTTSASLKQLQIPLSVIPPGDVPSVTLPKSDVVVKGVLGYFAFSKDQFFNPSRFNFLPIKTADQLDVVDYLLADYTPSREIGSWRVTEATFDLKNAFIDKDMLSWMIRAPKLGALKREIIIKDITIELDKQPIIRL